MEVCGREDSNLQGPRGPTGPKPAASASSATPAPENIESRLCGGNEARRRLRAHERRGPAPLSGRPTCRLRRQPNRRARRMPTATGDLGGAARRLRGAEAVHLGRAERRLSPLVSRRTLARLRLEPRRRGREEGEGPALRPPGGRRRAAAADRGQGVRRVDRLVARLEPHRLRAPRARRGVRGGGRPQAGAAALHPPLLQARQRRLDGRPPQARLRRRPRRRR